MNGRLTAHQDRRLLPIVRGREVHDLGSGNCVLASRLIDHGARYVYAVDKRYKHEKLEGLPPRVQQVGEYFADWATRWPMIDVAFVSWPQQYAIEGLVTLACVAKTVIYLGSNFDCSACGSPELFRYLRTREVQVHMPDRHNTLIVYGKHLDARRALLPEEYAGLHREGEPYAYGSLSSEPQTAD